jgi:hypothetical protein
MKKVSTTRTQVSTTSFREYFSVLSLNLRVASTMAPWPPCSSELRWPALRRSNLPTASVSSRQFHPRRCCLNRALHPGHSANLRSVPLPDRGGHLLWRLPPPGHGYGIFAKYRANQTTCSTYAPCEGTGRIRRRQFRCHSRQYSWFDSRFGPGVPSGPITFTQPSGLSGVGWSPQLE